MNSKERTTDDVDTPVYSPVCGNISSLDLITRAVTHNNFTAVEAILSCDPEILTRYSPEIFSDLLLTAVRKTSDTRILELLINRLILHGAEVEFEYLLTLLVRKGNFKAVEVFLKNGASFVTPGVFEMAKPILGLKYKESRRDALVMLINHIHTCTRLKDVPGLKSSLERILKILDGRVNEDSEVEIAKILFSSGMLSVDGEGYGASSGKPLFEMLHLYINEKKPKLVEVVLKNGVDVNWRSCKKLPLHSAAEHNDNVDVVALLLAHGAQIDAVSNNFIKRTALHVACAKHNDRIIDLLIQKGANISAQDAHGRTPFALLDPSIDRMNAYSECVKVMVKEFVKIGLENVLESDVRLIFERREAKDYMEKCAEELNQMAVTTFFDTHSYHSVLKKSASIKKLVRRVNDGEFVERFEEDVRRFPCYEHDLRLFFDRAVQLREERLSVEDKLRSVFGEYLPDLVIRSLAKNLNSEDLPSD